MIPLDGQSTIPLAENGWAQMLSYDACNPSPESPKNVVTLESKAHDAMES